MKERRFHFSIRTVLLVIIGVLNILIAAPLGYMTYKSFVNYYTAQKVRNLMEFTGYIYNAEKYLLIERAASTSIIFVPKSSESFVVLKKEIEQSRVNVDKYFDESLVRVNNGADPEIKKSFEDLKKSYADLKISRLTLDQTIQSTDRKKTSALADQIFDQATVVIKNINGFVDLNSRRIAYFNSDVTRQIRLTRLIWELSDYAGREYAILGRLIAQNKFPEAETNEILSDLRGRIKYGMEIAHGGVSISPWRKEILPALQEAETHYLIVFEQIKDLFDRPANASKNFSYPMSVEMWLQLASEAVVSFQEMTDSFVKANDLYVDQIEKNARRSIIFSLLLLISAFTLSGYTWWLINVRVINPVNSMVEALYKETKLSGQTLSEEEKDISLDEISKLERVLQSFQENSRQLHSERDKARAASIAKSEFLANMSHEIRTPMNVVVGLSSILSRSEPLTDKQKEFIKTLQISAESLLSLINDLLDFSKIETQHIELEKIPFNFERLVQEISLVKTFKAKQKDLTFEVDAADLNGKEYIGDPTRIHQIITNLCGNAIKFTEKGDVRLQIKTSPGSRPDYEDVQISVIDTGIGIPVDKIDLIFEKFTQADASIVRKYGGTGLGLAITKSLVEMMNGQISVESVAGQGAVFKVRLPMLLKAKDMGLKPSKAKKGKTAKKAEGKVLLVEDYEANAIVVSALLEEFGYQYDIVDDGQQAVEKFMENEYDIILMDVQMPGMDGYMATRAIREYENKHGRRRTKIIGLTANALKQDREKCLAAGMDDYLAKPFDQKIFKQKLMTNA